MKRIVDRGPSRGHRFLVMNGAGREAAFGTEEEAKAYINESQEIKVPTKPKKKGRMMSLNRKA